MALADPLRMHSLHSFLLSAALSISTQAMVPLLARADDGPELQLEHADIDASYSAPPNAAGPPAKRRECSARYMAGPGAGMPLGLGTAGLGSAFVFRASTPGSSSSSDRFSSRAAGIAGSVMIPAGVATFIYSAIKAKRNRRERQRVCGRPPRESWRLSGIDPPYQERRTQASSPAALGTAVSVSAIGVGRFWLNPPTHPHRVVLPPRHSLRFALAAHARRASPFRLALPAGLGGGSCAFTRCRSPSFVKSRP